MGIDYATMEKYDLSLRVYFDRWDRTWHAVVMGLSRGRSSAVTFDVSNQDPDVAVQTAIARFIAEGQPGEAGA